jgi:beta-lactamase regulating signal transducer with metallopeptidase domain
MSAAFGLHFAGLFLSYFLQVAVAYCACCLVNRLLHKPQQRFFLWMVFLLAAGTYWLATIFSAILGLSSSPAAGNLPVGSVPVLTHVFLVPLRWSQAILIAGEVIAVAYAVALVLLAGQVAWRHLQLRLLLRRAIEPSEGLAGLFQETSRYFKMSRSRLLVLPGLGSPATACWWNPRVLLPEVCEELGPTPQVADVLYHELVHVARRDYLWSGLSDLICRILFFHPAAWHARKQLRLQGELACDFAVVEGRPRHRADYADSLAYFVRLRLLQEGVSVGVDFAAPLSTLGIRIRTILETPQTQPWWKRTSRNAAALVLAAAVGVLSPALTILLDFARSAPMESVALVHTPAHTVAAHHRAARRASSPSIAEQPQNGDQDSLTGLRVRPALRETSAYRLTASDNNRPDADPSEDKLGWSEPAPAVRTVSGTILATAGQIPISKIPHRNDHDRDDR